MADLFTSDLHFFHDNVVKYSKRPWTAEEQTEILIKMWNKQVKKNDNVSWDDIVKYMAER